MTRLRLLPLTGAACLLLLSGCHRKTSAPGNSIPTASSTSVALPASNTAADAPNAPAVAESASGSLTAYSDPTSGVSFRYPSSWRPWHTGSPMHPPGLAQNAGLAVLTQVLDPQNTTLAKTNLVGVSFSYATRARMDEAACTKLAQSSVPGGRQAPSETIHGLVFARIEGSDAGMCHQTATVVNSVVRNGSCSLFERDVETICPEVRGPGNPVALSPTQRRALEAQLDRVMQSVALR